MPEILKERSELDPQFQWDLTPMFESDAAWETALDSLDADIESLAAFAGKLTDAVTIGAYLDASTEVSRKVERLYCYASQRHDEDTRDDKAQSMYARIGSKYVKMAAALSFAQPEILSLPEETLTAIVNDPAVADYKFNLEDLLRGKPHTLTKAEEKLLASFGEVMSAPSEIYHNLEDADLLFDAVKDGSGETVEVTGSNFVPLEMSTDRTLRENAFHSYYKSYREHINTFAASYAGAIKAATAEAAAGKNKCEVAALVGKLAAGVAHSIRNPLTGLKLRLFSFTRGMELSPAQQEDVQAMNEAVRHMEAITSNFLEFSRRPRLSKEPLDMSEVLDRTLILLQPRMEAYKVTLRRTRHAPLPRVDGDAEQLREALANLIINACEAAGTDGEVRISEERGRLAPLGPVVVIRIEDSGPGVPEELHEVIFQPFMSTKVEGTGLGLPIARRIFEEHGGWLHLHNAPGHGASFVMVLPVRKGDDVWLRSS